MIDQGREILEILETGTPVILLCGEIDYQNASKLKDAVRYLINKGYFDIHVNCSELEFIDSSGISAFISAWKSTNTVGGNVCLFYPPEQCLRLLRSTGLEEYFEIISADSKDPVPIQDTETAWRYSRFTVPAKADTVSSVRSKVARLAGTMGFSKQQLDDIILAVGEAASNSVRHGSPKGEQGRIKVSCERCKDKIIIEIKDEGCGFDPSVCPDVDPGQLVEGGRGVFFMRVFMDEVDFIFDCGTTVRLVKYL